MTLLLLPFSGSQDIAEKISSAGDFDVGELEVRRFPDGESYVRLRCDVSMRSIAIVSSMNNPDPKLAPLIFAAATARELGARRVGLIAPYLAYMRQDTRFRDGEAISAPIFARLLSGAFDWLVTVDPHLHRIGRMSDVYDIPAEALHAGPLLARWIGDSVTDPLLVGPDAESEQWVGAVANSVGAPYVVAQKRRLGDRHVEIQLPDTSRWKQRTPVVVDDIASSGRTLLEVAKLLQGRGMRDAVCTVIHGVFADQAFRELTRAFRMVATANTIQHPSNNIDVSGLIAPTAMRLGSGA